MSRCTNRLPLLASECRLQILQMFNIYKLRKWRLWLVDYKMPLSTLTMESNGKWHHCLLTYKPLGRISPNLQLWCTWERWSVKILRSYGQTSRWTGPSAGKIHCRSFHYHRILNDDSLNWFGCVLLAVVQVWEKEVKRSWVKVMIWPNIAKNGVGVCINGSQSNSF